MSLRHSSIVDNDNNHSTIADDDDHEHDEQADEDEDENNDIHDNNDSSSATATQQQDEDDDGGIRTRTSDYSTDSTTKYCCEGRLADGIIQVTQAMLWTPLAVLWLLLVVIVGAMFFFFMVGAVSRGDPTVDEQWLNYSIQALNVLFTYAAIANQPKRFRDLLRLQRMPKSSIGVDWEGHDSYYIFDYVPYWHRMFVIVNLNLNCIFQFINQTFRIIYFPPELATTHVVEVNLFFALSFLCAIIAPIHQYRMEQRVRKQGRAPPGQELDPIQKFMGRADFSYRELGVESYQYAIHVLRERFQRQETMMKQHHEEEDDEEDDSSKQHDSRTDRTAPSDDITDSTFPMSVRSTTTTTTTTTTTRRHEHDVQGNSSTSERRRQRRDDDDDCDEESHPTKSFAHESSMASSQQDMDDSPV